jgi:signal transduction histidine kinase
VRGTARRPGREDALVRGLLTAIAAFRWLAWVWLVVILAVSRDDLTADGGRPWLALVLAAAALAVTTAATLLARVDPDRLLSPWVIAGEIGVGAALALADPLAYAGDHPQSLASVWPLAGIFTAGVAHGGRAGLAAGAAVGGGRLAGDLVGSGTWTGDDAVSAVSTVVLFALAGGVAGLVARRLREAERTLSAQQAREEVARTLHDGVLQTLAIVQRRSDDPELARLAREQERDLREFLFGIPGTVAAGGDLGQRLRAVAGRWEDHHHGTARVVLADDLPALPQPLVDAIAGAVQEALTNAAKHGRATTATVYAEPDGAEVFCSVKDDGTGFDTSSTVEGVGLQRSIRGRIAEVGGRTEIFSRPGRGTEVRLWVDVGG